MKHQVILELNVPLLSFIDLLEELSHKSLLQCLFWIVLNSLRYEKNPFVFGGHQSTVIRLKYNSGCLEEMLFSILL